MSWKLFSWGRMAVAVCLLFASGGYARGAPSGVRQAEQGSPRAPVADHHTHIWSREAASLAVRPILPPIQVPDGIRRLLEEREELVKSKDAAILGRIYTEDAMVLEALAPTWLQGKSAVEWVADSVGSFRLTPVACRVEGSMAYVAGTYTVGEGESLEHVSDFLLVLHNGEDGDWRIAAETLTAKRPPVPEALTADALVAELDAAGIRRAAVLSVAFWYGEPGAEQGGREEYENVRRENDWVAEQAARHPERLVAVGSVNPLSDYAIQEIERIAALPNLKGLKLHLGNSDVDVRKAEHADKLRAVFAAANQHRLPIIIHLRSGDDYGPAHSEAFLNEVLPAAPDIYVQIAHMGATGPGYTNDDAFEVLAKAAEAGDPRMANVYVDVASSVTSDTPKEGLDLIAKRLRQFGIERVVFGSDRSPGFGNEPPADAWDAFRRLPLTPEELGTVAGNVAPHLRSN